MADYETIWKFKCGLCGKKQEGNFKLKENWAELKYGSSLMCGVRKHNIDICNECLNKILKL